MQATFPDDLKIVYRQHPLANHYWAAIAAEGAYAAGAQGKFFEYDELVFSQQRQMTTKLREKAVAMGKSAQEARSDEVQREVLTDLAGELGLDQARFRQDLESRAYLSQVQADTQAAMKVGARGTPASFVNGRFVSGARPFESFKAEVQKELDWDRNGNRPDFPKGTNVSQLKPKSTRPRGPDPNKVYDLTAGGAPFEGPAGAEVTILHYLDYQ